MPEYGDKFRTVESTIVEIQLGHDRIVVDAKEFMRTGFAPLNPFNGETEHIIDIAHIKFGRLLPADPFRDFDQRLVLFRNHGIQRNH